MIGEEPIYFIYGSIIHKIAEKYIEFKGKVPINEVTNGVMSGKIPMLDREGEIKKIPKLTQEYKNKLVDHTRAIKKISDQVGFDGYIEWPFNYDLNVESDNNLSDHPRIMNGYIDRLIEKDGKFWILDYKTTRTGWFRKTQKDILKDLQLRTYARVVQKTFNVKAEDIKAGLYYLEGSELVGACFTEKCLEDTGKELLKYYIEIEQADPNDVWGNVGPHCKRCMYSKICPFYSVT